MLVPVLLMVAAAAPVKVAAPGLQVVNLDQRLGDLVVERFAALAKQPDLKIIAARDVQQLLGFERQRQLMGCDDSGCMAELAGALGVDALLVGTLAKSGSSITLVLKAIRANDASEIVSDTARLANEDALQEWLEENAARFAQQIVSRVRGETSGPSASARWPKWTLLAGGLALGITGGVLRGLAQQSVSQLEGASSQQPVDVPATVSRGRSFETVGYVLIGVGAAAIVASIVLFIVQSGDSSSSVAWLPSTQNGGLAWSF